MQPAVFVMSWSAALLAQEAPAGTEGIAPELLAEARRIAAIAPADHAPPPRSVDVASYLLKLTLDPRQRRLEGSAELSFRTVGAPRRSVQLDADELEVHQVVDAAGKPLVFQREGTTLTIDLGRDVPPEEEARVRIDYGASPRRGLVFVGAGGPDAAPAATPPTDAVPPDSLPRDSLPTDSFMVWSQGECQMASAWFPCRDFPDDRASSELFVTVPDAFKTVSNGVLIESVPAGDGRRTDHWRMDFPHPAYLTSLAVGPFVEIDLGRVRDLPLLAYATADHKDAAAASLQPTGAMVEVLEELTGIPYPYPAYRQVCVAEFPYGGMENIGATTLDQEQLYAPPLLAEKRPDIDALVVHELAHQWFGDLVSVSDWADIWLAEGFATFAEPWWLEKRGSRDDALARWAELQEKSVEHRIEEPRPVVSSTWVVPDDVFDATVYENAACVLNLLRRTVGDEKFFGAVRAWLARYQGRSVGSAEFEATFQEVAGADTADLLHEWLHAPGLPAIEFSWSYDDARKRLEFSANQKQAGDRVPEVFHLPVDLAYQVGAARRTTRMQLDARKCRSGVECEERPRFVRFNAGGALFGNLTVKQEAAAWRDQLVSDTDMLGRREAAAALAEAWKGFAAAQLDPANETERRLTLAALARALVEDGAVAVRVAAAQALGVVGGDVARTALGAALWDGEARVREAAAVALGGPDEKESEPKDPKDSQELSQDAAGDEIAAGLLIRRFETERTTLVRSAVLRSLAQVGAGRVLPTLLAFADNEKAPPELRGEALVAAAGWKKLSAAELPAVLERAAKFSVRGVPRELRTKAIAALGELATQSDAACAALTTQLDDPSLAIISATLEALEAAPTPAAIPALVRFHGRAAFPDHRSRARALLGLLVTKMK